MLILNVLVHLCLLHVLICSFVTAGGNNRNHQKGKKRRPAKSASPPTVQDKLMKQLKELEAKREKEIAKRIDEYLPIMSDAEETLEHALFLSNTFRAEYQRESDGFFPSFEEFVDLAFGVEMYKQKFMYASCSTIVRRTFWKIISKNLEGIISVGQDVNGKVQSDIRLSASIYPLIEQIVRAMAVEFNGINYRHKKLYRQSMEKVEILDFSQSDMQKINKFIQSSNSDEKLVTSMEMRDIFTRFPRMKYFILELRKETNFFRDLSERMKRIDFSEPDAAFNLAIDVYEKYENFVEARKLYSGLIIESNLDDEFIKQVRVLSLLVRLVEANKGFLASLGKSVRKFFDINIEQAEVTNFNEHWYYKMQSQIIEQFEASSFYNVLLHIQTLLPLETSAEKQKEYHKASPVVRQLIVEAHQGMAHQFRRKLVSMDVAVLKGEYDIEIIEPVSIVCDEEESCSSNAEKDESEEDDGDDSNEEIKLEDSDESDESVGEESEESIEEVETDISVLKGEISETKKEIIEDLWLPEEFHKHQEYLKWAKHQKKRRKKNNIVISQDHNKLMTDGEIEDSYGVNESVCDYIQTHKHSTKYYYSDERYFLDQYAPNNVIIFSKQTMTNLCKLKGELNGGWNMSWNDFLRILYEMNGTLIKRKGSKRTVYIPNPVTSLTFRIDESHNGEGPKLNVLKEFFFNSLYLDMRKFFPYIL